MSTKPILFNTEMVQAILDGRKTVTRRLMKPQPEFLEGETGTPMICDDGITWTFKIDQYSTIYDYDRKAPCSKGDILYVRETWAFDTGDADDEIGTGYFAYRADDLHHPDCKWRPSIHMPKEAARIFLRVKDVRVERLQDITVDQVAAEGIDNVVPAEGDERLCDYCPLPDEVKGAHCYGGPVHMCEGSHCKDAMEYWEEEFIGEFAGLWESTIKDKDIGDYGWDANPWVWVIEFEKISKEEAMKC